MHPRSVMTALKRRPPGNGDRSERSDAKDGECRQIRRHVTEMVRMPVSARRGEIAFWREQRCRQGCLRQVLRLERLGDPYQRFSDVWKAGVRWVAADCGGRHRFRVARGHLRRGQLIETLQSTREQPARRQEHHDHEQVRGGAQRHGCYDYTKFMWKPLSGPTLPQRHMHSLPSSICQPYGGCRGRACETFPDRLRLRPDPEL